MGKIVMVTGGTGYIGNWIVKYLLEKGYTVRLTLRDKSRLKKFSHLGQIADKSSGNLEIWEANLLVERSYDPAAKGADAIIHAASPFKLKVRDAQKDLLDPALNGTRNVLQAASNSGTVKKIVLTSSVAAVHGDAIDMKELGIAEFDENQFNYSSTPDHQPYSYSKVLAEKAAWEMAEAQDKWELVVINPSFVMGPALHDSPDSESVRFMQNMLKGKFFMGAPELWYGFVDVRDVAKAHVIALENEKARGRHILSERTMSFVDFAGIIRKVSTKKYLLPRMKSPKFLVSLLGGSFGLTKRFVKRNVGFPVKLNNTKSIKELGLVYTPIEMTTKDMIDQLEASGMV